MLKNLLKSSLIPSSICALLVGNMHLKNSGIFTPKEYDFSQKKQKKIVVVGAGIIGLTTAYFLANNPDNEVTVIERSEKPYQHTSFQNGCYFHTQGVESWINKPFYMFVQAIYKKNHFSKVYLGSLLQDPKTTLKFGYLWFFFQPTKDDEFPKCILDLFVLTEN